MRETTEPLKQLLEKRTSPVGGGTGGRKEHFYGYEMFISSGYFS
jgi:hypothetical protein